MNTVYANALHIICVYFLGCNDIDTPFLSRKARASGRTLTPADVPRPLKEIKRDLQTIVTWLKERHPDMHIHVLNAIPRPKRGEAYHQRMVALNKDYLSHGLTGAKVHRFSK